MTRSASPSKGNGRAVGPGAARPHAGGDGTGDLLKAGDKVLVTDPDDATWRGRITVPSVLWTGWWVVNPLTAQRGRTGKTGARHVHESEMKILWEAKNEPA